MADVGFMMEKMDGTEGEGKELRKIKMELQGNLPFVCFFNINYWNIFL